jgi:GxxExxY protein
LILVHRELTERIIKCFFDVYNELGHGFPERVLRRAMMIAMLEKDLRAEEEVQLKVHFRGEVIGTFFVDIVVEGSVLVEIKALPELDKRSVSQLLNYLRAAGGGVGLLLNFGQRPEFSRRVVGDIAKIEG